MSTASARIAAAFRRLGAVVGIKSVRAEDAERAQRHGGPPSELNGKVRSFADEVERRVAKEERKL